MTPDPALYALESMLERGADDELDSAMKSVKRQSV